MNNSNILKMNNIQVKTYKNLNDLEKLKYDFLFALKPKPSFMGHNSLVKELSWNEVKAIIKLMVNFEQNNAWKIIIDIFETCFGVDEGLFWRSDIVSFFSARAYLIDVFTKIRENEVRLLHGDSLYAEVWKEAGGHKLNPFNDLIPLIELGKIYHLNPIELGGRQYSEILTLLVVHEIQANVMKTFNVLKKRYGFS